MDETPRNSFAVQAPFNLQATVRLIQRRPSNEVDHWENGRYLRAIETSGGVRRAAVVNVGTIDAPEVRLEIDGGPVSYEIVAEITTTLRLMLGLDHGPAPTAWLAEKEPAFAQVATALRGFRSPCFPTLFETACRVLPFQQLSLDAGTAIVGRFVRRFGASIVVDGREWHAFPSPETIAATPVEALREVGLSRPKAVALRSLAERALAGELVLARFQSLPTEDVLKQLIALPGVGPWTAAVIMLRGMRRMDVFPTGDVGAARNLPALLGRSERWTPTDASEFAVRFGDRRGYLYFLGLGAQLLARGLI
jgi:3-methyladenine DNA glycosylase/8-oxoguanine DNA glycosylase